MSTNTLSLKVCPKCGAGLSYTSYEAYCAYTDCLWNNNDFSPPPAQESQSESIAAPVEAVQGQGTPTLEQFQRWLENKAHEARFAIEDGCDYFDRTCVHGLALLELGNATALLMQFKLEQGA